MHDKGYRYALSFEYEDADPTNYEYRTDGNATANISFYETVYLTYP